MPALSGSVTPEIFSARVLNSNAIGKITAAYGATSGAAEIATHVSDSMADISRRSHVNARKHGVPHCGLLTEDNTAHAVGDSGVSLLVLARLRTTYSNSNDTK